MDFEQIYKAYYIHVFSYVMTLSNNPDEAEEITQKAFYKALLSFEKFRGEASHYTWICAIARNIFLDKKRAEQSGYDDLIKGTASASFPVFFLWVFYLVFKLRQKN